MTRHALDGVVVLAAATLMLIAATGGVDLEIGGVPLRARDPLRPAAILALALGARGALTLRRRGATDDRTSAMGAAAAELAACGMLAMVLAAAGAYAQYHVRVAGGLDSYGYVSAARLIASGRLSEPQPLAAVLPFDNALQAATPLGQVAGADGRSSVPRFPLGLPLLMALFTVFGPAGPYFAPLVMAYAALFLVYLIARGSCDRLTGLLAAALVAVNPVFAVYASQPLSDVPAACWLLAAVLMALPNRSRLSISLSIAAGICAGMAVLTRPVLLPAVAMLVLVAVITGSSPSRYALTGTVLAIVALQLALNVRLYGGATMSGYGTTAHMFELSFARLGANVSNFAKWLTYSHTPLFWTAWPVALVVLRRDRWAWSVSAIAAAAAAPFLFYMVFDNSASSRFVLPSIVLVLVLFARATAVMTSHPRLTPALRAVVLLSIAVGCAVASHRSLQREGVALGATLEAKYPLVGEWFRTNTSERAVVLASLHSGAIRLYGERQTIRWDQIPENALTSTIERLAAAGYEPYLALDLPSEPAQFDERFRGQSIPIDPVARVRVVNIYKFVSAR